MIFCISAEEVASRRKNQESIHAYFDMVSGSITNPHQSLCKCAQVDCIASLAASSIKHCLKQ